MSKPKWECVYESDSSAVDRLFAVYKESPSDARVLHILEPKRSRLRIVLYEYEDGSFSFVEYLKSYGISRTNRIYSSQKMQRSYIYKASTKSFWVQNDRFVQPMQGYHFHSANDRIQDIMKHKFVSRFGWVRLLYEDSEFFTLTLNHVFKKKLFSRKKLMTDKYGTNYPVSVKLSESDTFKYRNRKGWWTEVSKYLTNLENLSPELFDHHLFDDTVRLAMATNQKINCLWSAKRIELQHNIWNKQVLSAVMRHHVVESIPVRQVYFHFAIQSGYEVITTTDRLIAEGQTLAHCVGTYKEQILRGSGIFHALGATLQLSSNISYDLLIVLKERKTLTYEKLSVSQYRGFKNSQPSIANRVLVQLAVDLFNAGQHYDAMQKLLQEEVVLNAYLDGKIAFKSDYSPRTLCTSGSALEARLPMEMDGIPF